jgi:hypothetical protein
MLTIKATATTPEKDLISLYSSVVQGIKPEVSRPCTSNSRLVDFLDGFPVLICSRLSGVESLLDHSSCFRSIPGQMGT